MSWVDCRPLDPYRYLDEEQSPTSTTVSPIAASPDDFNLAFPISCDISERIQIRIREDWRTQSVSKLLHLKNLPFSKYTPLHTVTIVSKLDEQEESINLIFKKTFDQSAGREELNEKELISRMKAMMEQV